jgi:hypothetical protein
MAARLIAGFAHRSLQQNYGITALYADLAQHFTILQKALKGL